MKWKLKQYLEEHDLTPHALSRESNLSTATIYPMARGQAERISLQTIDRVVDALRSLTGESVGIADLLECEATAQSDTDLAEAELGDYAAMLAEVEADVPAEELAAWNEAFAQASRPNR